MLQEKAYGDGLEPAVARREDRIAELEREVAQLKQALERRQQYGVVTGLLAVRFNLTPERTWRLLVRLSQRTNLKLWVVARIVIDSHFGRLDPADRPLADRVDRELRGQLEPTPAG